MELIFLGTGTSDGVPVIGCSCRTCFSADRRDKRTRSSVYLIYQGMCILIDASIDLRQQLLREKIDDIDVILLTHPHTDHILGLDDIRPVNQKQKKKVFCYGSRATCDDIRLRFPYFFHYVQVGGGIPRIELKEIQKKFTLQKGDSEVSVIPLPVFHGKVMINGYRIGRMAYITAASHIPDSTYSLLEDLDILVINALRRSSHNTHFSFEEAVAQAEKIGAARTYLTHICHDLFHSDMLAALGDRNIFPAFDGCRVSVKNIR